MMLPIGRPSSAFQMLNWPGLGGLISVLAGFETTVATLALAGAAGAAGVAVVRAAVVPGAAPYTAGLSGFINRGISTVVMPHDSASHSPNCVSTTPAMPKILPIMS